MRATLASLVLGTASLAGPCTTAMADTGLLSIVDLPAPAKLQPGVVVQSKPFGGEFSGRVLWLSANGRYAALFRLTEDTDKNGKLNIQFGMHGDSWGDELALDVFDIDADTRQRFDDVLVGDPQGRFLVLTRGKDTLLFDSENGHARNLRELGGGAPSDLNACMSPRQIAFDDTGERIALLRDQPAELAIFTPATDSSRVIYRADRPIWRVEFTSDPSQLLLTEAKGEFPRQFGSCVSRSRSEFAASYSTNGIDPKLLTYAYVGVDGRRVALEERPVTLSSSVYALGSVPRLQRMAGGEVAIPEGCKAIDGADGSGVLVLECGPTIELFDPARGLRRALPPGESLKIIAGERSITRDGTWQAVQFPIKGATDHSDAKYRLGRLRLDDLRIERGPPVYFCLGTNHPQWLAAGRNDEYYMFNVASGAIYTAHSKDTDIGHSRFALDPGHQGPFLLLDPENHRQAQWPGNIGADNGHGCFISPQGKRMKGWNPIDPGPWTRICVAPPPAGAAPSPGS